jgi:succinate dehydrogenase/fumarate reductase flavoprotein subunit
MSTKEIDVIIVGGGGAACRAAIAAADAGAQVAIVVKGQLGKCGATAYKVAEMGGFNAADGRVDPVDSPREHYGDIIAAAQGMADPQLARIVAEEAPLALESLEGWGVPFERDGHGYLEFLSCFATRPRTHVIKGHGEPIIRALISQIAKRAIQVYENSLVTDLFVEHAECVGVGILDRDGRYRACPAGAVVLATGGAGQLFKRNMNPPDICGDGYALGYEAGADLVNMEFMQAGVGISHPILNLFNAWLWTAHPALTNTEGRPFLPDYLPPGLRSEDVMDVHAGHFPFSSSDNSRYIELAVQAELAEGRGTREGGVNVDFRGLTPGYLESLPMGSAFRKMWPITTEFLRSRGVEVMKTPLQIACFAHAINGGLRIDTHGGTTVPGLYAAGEVAGGPHGADRLGGNMLVTCQVFGARAGSSAASYARDKRHKRVPPESVTAKERELRAHCAKAVHVQELNETLQCAAQSRLLIRRSEQGLRSFLETVASIRETIDHARGAGHCSWEVWELGSLLRSGEIMARAALRRRESRGSHFRMDVPQRDDANFGKPFVVRRGTSW